MISTKPKKIWTSETFRDLLDACISSSEEDLLENPPKIVQEYYDHLGIICLCVFENRRIVPDEYGHRKDCIPHNIFMETFREALENAVLEGLKK